MNDSWFVKNNLKPPEHISHGITDEQLASNMKSVNPRNWRLEGNRLIADTDVGPLVNIIDPSYILTGVDDKGQPVLTKLDL